MKEILEKDIKYKANLSLTAFSCLGIVDIEHDIDDYAIVDYVTPQKIYRSRLKIYSTMKGRNYIKKNGSRYYIDEFLRIDI